MLHTCLRALRIRLIVNHTPHKKKKKKVILNHTKAQRELVVLSKTWNQSILYACLLLYSIYPSIQGLASSLASSATLMSSGILFFQNVDIKYFTFICFQYQILWGHGMEGKELSCWKKFRLGIDCYPFITTREGFLDMRELPWCHN